MRDSLKKFILLYATKSNSEIVNYLERSSKEDLQKILLSIVKDYYTDKNSSSLREMATVWVAGYSHNPEKQGYDGHKQENGRKINCEVKPQNYSSPKRRLQGSGSFNDYTPKRYKTDCAKNPNVLFSGFKDGRLIYILETPFSNLAPKIKEQLDKRWPDGVRKSGEYLRGARVSYRHCANQAIKIVYVVDKGTLDSYKDFMGRHLYNFLMSHYPNEEQPS